MEKTMPVVLVSGAGQLGTRHLQGLAGCGRPLEIHVQDPREASLSRAMQVWNDAGGTAASSHVSFHGSLESVPRELDVAIVATTADIRPAVTGLIARHAAVRYWILEKVLAQNERGLDELQSHAGNPAAAWVNTPRRIMPWHQAIRSHLTPGRPVNLEVRGAQWGLACNAIHFLDLVAWWTGEALEEVSTRRLCPQWVESKRQGFMEVFGTLEARFSGGSRAALTADETGTPVTLALDDGRHQWQIVEAAGLARRSDGFQIPGSMTYQSALTGPLVESILERGRCDLPTLQESARIHRVFLRAMHLHWQHAGHPSSLAVPIT
jgi:hypothetical protein